MGSPRLRIDTGKWEQASDKIRDAAARLAAVEAAARHSEPMLRADEQEIRRRLGAWQTRTRDLATRLGAWKYRLHRKVRYASWWRRWVRFSPLYLGVHIKIAWLWLGVHFWKILVAVLLVALLLALSFADRGLLG